MALTEIYVDPSIAADSGAGTVGDPYGDLEYAIEQETFDTTNGTRVNIKAGTDEVLAANLSTALADTSVSVAWAPTATAPLVFQGYTSTAGDGGIGGISGGGSVSVYSDTTLDYVHFRDLHCHNTGANGVLRFDNYCSVINCEVNNTTATAVQFDVWGVMERCYVYDALTGFTCASTCFVNFNYFKNTGTTDFDVAINASGASNVSRNIIDIDGTTDGIRIDNDDYVSHNSIYSNAGSGQGIVATSNSLAAAVVNNVIEGFSTAGGIGIDLSGEGVRVYGGNAVFNCDTAYSAPDFAVIDYGDNETLTASPFTNASGGNFAPVNTGNVKEGSVPEEIGGGLV